MDKWDRDDAPPVLHAKIESQRKLLDSCRKAMAVSQRFYPSGTDWSHMIAAIDAEIDGVHQQTRIEK